MELVVLAEPLSVFQIHDVKDIDLSVRPLYLGLTQDELSVVAPTTAVPEQTVNREDGWRAFKISGVLDFSLVGILAKISSLLADESISIFAISTYNTDYVLVKEGNYHNAVAALQHANYTVITAD
ncbi:MAG: ACT domain-containing protein [Leuconostoc fallax]